MRVRSFIGLLAAVAVVVYAVVLHTNNRELFQQRFHLGPETSIPLWGALLAIFLLGFLPTGVTLVVDTLRLDLSQRRDRRRQREDESLEATLRRAVDFQADGQWGKAAAELETYLAAKPDHFAGAAALRRGPAPPRAHRRGDRGASPRRGDLSALGEPPLPSRCRLSRARRRRDRPRDRVADRARLPRLRPRGAARPARGGPHGPRVRHRPRAARAHHRAAERERRLGGALARESSLAQGLTYQQGVRMLEEDRVDRSGDALPRTPGARAEVHPGAHHARRGGAPRGSRGGGDRRLARRLPGDRQPGLPAADRGLLHRAGRADARHRDPARAHRDGRQRPAAALLPRPPLLPPRDARGGDEAARRDRRAHQVVSDLPFPARPDSPPPRRPAEGGRVVRRLPAAARRRQRRVSLPRLPPALRRLARLLLALRLVEFGRPQLRGGAALGGGARRPRRSRSGGRRRTRASSRSRPSRSPRTSSRRSSSCNRSSKAIAAGRLQPVYLVHGSRALAEPSGLRLAEALGKALGCAPQVVRRPDEIADVAADLRTFSLFADGKVVAVVESGVFADRATAATLFEEVRQQLPWSGGPDDLSGKARDAATRLLQVLRLFDLDPAALGFERAIAALPEALLAGKAARGGGKGKGGVGGDPGRAPAAARGGGRVGPARTRRERRFAGRRSRARRSAGAPRPGADRERRRRRAIRSSRRSPAARRSLSPARSRAGKQGGFDGLPALAGELAARDRRGDRSRRARRRWRSGPCASRRGLRRQGREIDADSMARFAGEYRKLAALSGGATIQLAPGREERRGSRPGGRLPDARRDRRRPRRGGARAGSSAISAAPRIPLAARLHVLRQLAASAAASSPCAASPRRCASRPESATTIAGSTQWAADAAG